VGVMLWLAVVRYVDLALPFPVSWRDAQILAWDGMGRVPDRCAFLVVFPSMVGNYCGSPQSLRAMVSSWAYGWRLRCSSSSGDFVFVGVEIWRQDSSLVDTEVLRDLLVIFVLVEGLCEIWLGHLITEPTKL
jgi:hypothetical protein